MLFQGAGHDVKIAVQGLVIAAVQPGHEEINGPVELQPAVKKTEKKIKPVDQKPHQRVSLCDGAHGCIPRDLKNIHITNIIDDMMSTKRIIIRRYLERAAVSADNQRSTSMFHNSILHDCRSFPFLRFMESGTGRDGNLEVLDWRIIAADFIT